MIKWMLAFFLGYFIANIVVITYLFIEETKDNEDL